jgi:chaperonin cofactor prefoldin
LPGAVKFKRLNSLGEDYTEAAIMERLTGTRTVTAPPKSIAPTLVANEKVPSLLIDIQQKMQEGKGEGYRHWAVGFNLKQMSKNLLFLQSQGIDSYDALCAKSSEVSAEFHKLTDNIKSIEKRLKEITELQKQIGTYGKTKEVYAKYKASGWNQNFYDAHVADILLHKAAKKYFDSLGLKKLPKMADLKQEYAMLAAQKKKLYSGYHELKEKSRNLSTAKMNADTILGIRPSPQKSHEHGAR